MGQGYYAELKKLLGENGCSVIRQGKGSHEIWYSPHTPKPVTVSVTVNSRNTANAILKQAGINKKL